MLVSRSFAVAVCVACLSTSAGADDALNAMDTARKSYMAGDRVAAREQMELALKLMAEGQRDELTRLLPDPPPGWKADSTNYLDGLNKSPPLVLRDYLDETRTYQSGSLTLPFQVTVSIKPDPGLALRYIEASRDRQKAVAQDMEFISVGNVLVYKKLCPSTWCSDTGEVHIIRIIDNKIVVGAWGRATPVEEMLPFVRAVRPALAR